MGELKPCECGGIGILNIDQTEYFNGHCIRWAFVKCEKCGKTSKVISEIVFNIAKDTTIENAISEWNKREA